MRLSVFRGQNGYIDRLSAMLVFPNPLYWDNSHIAAFMLVSSRIVKLSFLGDISDPIFFRQPQNIIVQLISISSKAITLTAKFIVVRLIYRTFVV